MGGFFRYGGFGGRGRGCGGGVFKGEKGVFFFFLGMERRGKRRNFGGGVSCIGKLAKRDEYGFLREGMRMEVREKKSGRVLLRVAFSFLSMCRYHFRIKSSYFMFSRFMLSCVSCFAFSYFQHPQPQGPLIAANRAKKSMWDSYHLFTYLLTDLPTLIILAGWNLINQSI